MKCLTREQSEEWFAVKNVEIDGNWELRFSREPQTIMTNMPKTVSALNRFSDQLILWLSPDCPTIMWLSSWNTEPPAPLAVFEKVRMGCGENRHVINAPGHLFEEPTEQENTLITGLVFLVMAFNWEAYVVPKHRDEFIYLGDEHVVYSSRDAQKMSELMNLIARFELEVITDIRQAWR